MLKNILRLIAVILVVGLAAGAYLIVVNSEVPYKGYDGTEQFVEVPPGATPNTIARRLQAGEYRFDRPLRAREVIDMLARGEVYLRPVTFREGLTIKQMAAEYEKAGLGAAKDFIKAASNGSLIADLDPEAGDLEGYLFPNTYSMPRRATAAQLVEKMVTAFRDALTPDITARATARGLGVRELVTLASIVEKETGKAEERPVVAAVYSNRLKIGMGLQCDPTVIYALERAGQYTGNLTRDDLRFDSPYNTYRYAGLPPGPIAAPGRASLEATVAPAEVPYIYFVSRNDGTHAFATTLDEHNRNVFEYQVKPFRR